MGMRFKNTVAVDEAVVELHDLRTWVVCCRRRCGEGIETIHLTE
jgi:hypothetical protein